MEPSVITNFFATMAVVFLVSAVLSLFFYIYFAITLMIIARKTSTRNGWMAWLPIFNLFLMCAIGRRSYWWFLGLLIPAINLFVLALLWASIAAARQKPAWTGALMLIPPFTLFIPAYLAIGKGRDSSAAPHCSACNAAAAQGELFCGHCGKPIAAAGPSALHVPLAVPALAAAAMFVICAGLIGATGWYFFVREIPYSPPTALQPPAVPSQMAATLNNIPIDPDPTAPTIPISLVSQNFSTDKSPNNVGVPQNWLPPSISANELPQAASAVTSIAYSQPSTVTTASPDPSGKGQVYVNILNTTGRSNSNLLPPVSGLPRGGNFPEPGGPTITTVDPGSGLKTATRRPPEGFMPLDGSTGADPSTIVLKPEANITIIIYAPDPSMQAVAKRITQNITKPIAPRSRKLPTSLGVLPANLPAGLVLQQTTIHHQNAATAALAALGSHSPQVPQGIQQLLPQQAIFARYHDPSQQDWHAFVLDYGSPRTAWNSWLFFRYTVGGGRWNSATVTGATARYISTPEESILIFHKGPFVVILTAPPSVPPAHLTEFANAFQM